MFYEINNSLQEIDACKIDKNKLTVGCISSEELRDMGKTFGFDEETIVATRLFVCFRTFFINCCIACDNWKKEKVVLIRL